MPEQKSFWKKYEFVIIAIITLAFIYALIFFNQKINFLLGNELIVYLTPQQKSYSMHYGNVSEINFDISIGNVAYCGAHCSFSFNDRSRNELIEKSEFQIEKGEHLIKSYNLSVKRLGSGQDIYSFDLGCRSVRTYLCLTKGDEKSRSSLVVVNYDLTETEKNLKEILKQNVTGLLQDLRRIDLLHQKVNQKYFELGYSVNLQNLSRQKIGIDDNYDKTRIEIENFRSLWSVENYLKLDELFNESFSDRLKEIRNSIESLNESIDAVVELHNNLMAELRNILNVSNELNSVLNDDIKQGNFSSNIINLYEIGSSLINNTFKDYDDLAKDIAKIKSNQDSLIEGARTPAARFFFGLVYNSEIEKELLCSLKQECSINASLFGLLEDVENFIKDYPNSLALKQECSSLSELNHEYSAVKGESLLFIKDNNISFPESSISKLLTGSFKENKERDINNTYYNSFLQIKLENKTSKLVMEIAEPLLPGNLSSMIPLAYNESLNLSLYLLSELNLSGKSEEFLIACSKVEKNPDINLTLEPVSSQNNYTITSSIETNLSDNPPICCVLGDCKGCCRDDSCRDDSKTFPVIFLHGHSLAESNSPEFSLDSFNKLQIKLQDDGYLNAGIVSLYSKNEPLQQGIWGLSGKPVTVKVSYYYDAFRKDDKYIVIPTKSENIDTYALRLKELIEIVKQRTNKEKVNIIAHSMGSLVSRRYIQIFGEGDINKLIMIAAPNKGISGSTSSYCGIIGENRECQDMRENSLFLNKLNDPLKQPEKVKQYVIIGQGCKTNGKDGDGIVTVDNVKLSNATLYYINGTCDGLFGGVLHTEILNVEEYPETYRIVKKILQK